MADHAKSRPWKCLQVPVFVCTARLESWLCLKVPDTAWFDSSSSPSSAFPFSFASSSSSCFFFFFALLCLPVPPPLKFPGSASWLAFPSSLTGPWQPIPPKFRGWNLPPKFGWWIVKKHLFYSTFKHQPWNLGGENAYPPNLGGMARHRQVTDLDVTFWVFRAQDCLPRDRCSVGTRHAFFLSF